MTTPRGKQRANSQQHGSMEWYTPLPILEKIAAFYGGTYFDPCPASYGNIRENGLMLPWRGKVYVNPPYGAAIKPWIVKATTEPVSELILLVPASTDTAWFAPLWSYTLCFVSGRIMFRRPGGATDHAPHASVLVYRGRRTRKFAEAFCDLGPIVRTTRPRDDGLPKLWPNAQF